MPNWQIVSDEGAPIDLDMAAKTINIPIERIYPKT